VGGGFLMLPICDLLPTRPPADSPGTPGGRPGTTAVSESLESCTSPVSLLASWPPSEATLPVLEDHTADVLRAFRSKPTTDSAPSRPPLRPMATNWSPSDWNRWSLWTGTGGRVAPEWVVGLPRNMQRSSAEDPEWSAPREVPREGSVLIAGHLVFEVSSRPF